MRYIRAQYRSCFDYADFSAQNIACGLSTECMKRRARVTVVPYIHTYTLRTTFPSMWGSLRLAPIMVRLSPYPLRRSIYNVQWLDTSAQGDNF